MNFREAVCRVSINPFSLYPVFPLSLLFCPASGFFLFYSVNFPIIWLKLILLSRVLFASVTFLRRSLLTECKVYSLWNTRSIHRSPPQFICWTYKHLWILALSSLSPLTGVHVQPSVKDKGTFWPRQIALEKGSSPPLLPHPHALHSQMNTYTVPSCCPSPSIVTKKASVCGPRSSIRSQPAEPLDLIPCNKPTKSHRHDPIRPLKSPPFFCWMRTSMRECTKPCMTHQLPNIEMGP